MKLTQEQKEFRDGIREFVARECGTREQREAWLDPGEEDHSTALYRKLAELGWAGISIPQAYGGAGGSHVDQMIFFEELYAGLVPVKGSGASTTCAGIYRRFGSEDQKRDALAKLADGAVMSISISEPEAGSDVANIRCRAERVDGGFVINGQKTWCSYAHLAERIVLVARTSTEEVRHRGLTLLEVPGDAPGLGTSRISTLGGREVNDVFYTDVFVPASAVIGEVGAGFAQIMAGLDGERVLGAAVGIGLARRALDDLLAYVGGHDSSGASIGSAQAVRHRIVDLALELECARLLTYEVAEMMADGPSKEVTRLTSMAKIKTSETARRITLEGMELMGSDGYGTAHDMEAHVRHAMVLPIYAGTNEIQREIISRSLGLEVV